MTGSDTLEQSRPPWRILLLGIAIIVMGLWFLVAHIISWVVYEQHLDLASRFFQIGGGLLHIGCGVGLLKWQNWARYLFIILMIRILPHILQTSIAYADRLLRGATVAWFFEVPTFLVLAAAWVLILYGPWVLTRPKIKGAFSAREGQRRPK